MVQRAVMIGFILLIYCIDISVSMNISTDESALLAFKAQIITNDPNETLSKNWTQGTGVCSWIGISCSTRHQRVVALNLKSLRLRGSIPKEIGNLSFLSSLQIGNNTFVGEIPDEIGRLKRLKYLSLQLNNLTGEIPQSLGFLSRLEVLDLSENDLFGNVPLSIFNMSALKIIDLAWNDELSGTLPNEICSNLPVLQYISMANNQLVGELPSGLDKCTQLEVLSLSYNRFTGNLPRDMWNMSKLQDMFLGWNKLTEYGSEGLVSTMGDVYSYGILLMETFTRKKPMDNLFVEELTLKRWVFESFPDRVMDVVDANLFSRQDEQFSSKEICIKLLMELALQCTSESPQDRITMKDVLIRLNKIQTNFSQSATRSQNGR